MYIERAPESNGSLIFPQMGGSQYVHLRLVSAQRVMLLHLDFKKEVPHSNAIILHCPLEGALKVILFTFPVEGASEGNSSPFSFRECPESNLSSFALRQCPGSNSSSFCLQEEAPRSNSSSLVV